MNILVTGGAGFIGSHLTEALLEKGHQVTVLDNLSTGKKENVPQDARFRETDICDHAAVQALLKEGNFEALFHLAAQIDVRKSVAEPVTDAETNILATLNLIDSAAKNGVKTFIFSSTGGAMYGETETRPTPETHPENPLSPYGIGKLAIDKYLHFYNLTSPLRTVSLRYGNVYGPRQNPHGEAGVVAIFINKMQNGENPLINGEGEQTRDYVFVEDVVTANILALEKKEMSGVFNIGTGQETSVNKIFHALNTLFGENFKERHAPAKPGEQKTSCLDTTKIKKQYHWEPKVSLEEGLQKTVAWFQNKAS